MNTLTENELIEIDGCGSVPQSTWPETWNYLPTTFGKVGGKDPIPRAIDS